jgi:hypothetical protein
LILLLVTIAGVNAQNSKDNTVVQKRPVADSVNHIEKLIAEGKTTGQRDTAYAPGSLRQAAMKQRQYRMIFYRQKLIVQLAIFTFCLIYTTGPDFSRAADMFYEPGAQHMKIYRRL